MKKTLIVFVSALVILSTLLVSSTAIAQENPNNIVAVNVQSSSITWTPILKNIKGMTLTIVGSNGFYSQQQYDKNARPVLSSGGLGDGTYTYDIVLWPNTYPDPEADQTQRGLNSAPQDTMRQSGAFTVRGGAFVTAATESGANNGNSAPGVVLQPDVVNADDAIVQGSLCVGLDCVNNESFGFDTIRLKENNTRIGFDDTSVGAFPANDWTIVANDSASGGASFLAFEDVTGSKFPFKVTAGARTNALFVSDAGNIGIGTGSPVLDVHIVTSDTPGLRLEQDGAGGFTAQTWDIAGNEANFFIRDITGGSRLPFRIRPGAPTSSIDIAANGNVGIGTASPTSDLDIVNTGAAAIMLVRRTDAGGSSLRLASGINLSSIGTVTNSPLGFLVNSIQKMTLATDGSLTVLGPVNATVFNPTSDRKAKENFAAIDQANVLERLSVIPISTWNFIDNDNKVIHMGPMAQDFYAAFGLGADDKHISTVDADGVAFAAIQELNKRNQTLSSENKSLNSKVDVLAARISALETGDTSTGQSSQNGMIILLAGINLILLVFLVWSMRRGSFSAIKSGVQ